MRSQKSPYLDISWKRFILAISWICLFDRYIDKIGGDPSMEAEIDPIDGGG